MAFKNIFIKKNKNIFTVSEVPNEIQISPGEETLRPARLQGLSPEQVIILQLFLNPYLITKYSLIFPTSDSELTTGPNLFKRSGAVTFIKAGDQSRVEISNKFIPDLI